MREDDFQVANTSRAPSYFSQFFEEQLRREEGTPDGVRTLYIDRDPATFEDISLHLQGYHVRPRDGEHFVKLFADAQFFSRKLLPPSIKRKKGPLLSRNVD